MQVVCGEYTQAIPSRTRLRVGEPLVLTYSLLTQTSVTEFRVTARSRAREDLLWYMRHADALARRPIPDEPWAPRIEARRLGVDHPDRGDITYLHGVGR